MLKKISGKVRRLAKRSFGIGAKKDLNKVYSGQEYLDEYKTKMDKWIAANPQSAIGGKWEEIGTLQFEFLESKGLKPTHELLDLGCGTLRGGRHFIAYLDPGNYWGIDISPQAIERAQALIIEEHLTAKKPVLLVNRDGNLKFEEFNGKKFGFILAQSVFTHLRPEHIEECFANIGNIFDQNTSFFFTYFNETTFKLKSRKNFGYPLQFFETLAQRYGFKLRDFSDEYPHPRNQHMLQLTLGE